MIADYACNKIQLMQLQKERKKENKPILIEYNNLPTRYRFCLDTKHKIKVCSISEQAKQNQIKMSDKTKSKYDYIN